MLSLDNILSRKAGTTWLNIEKKLFKIYEKSFALVIKNVEDDNVPADGATYKMTNKWQAQRKKRTTFDAVQSWHTEIQEYVTVSMQD